MSTQTALGHSFPTPCKQCGGALYRQVDYCPYCGAVHPLEESSYRRTPFAGRRTGASDQAGQKFHDVQASSGDTATVHAVRPDEAAPSAVSPRAAPAAAPHTAPASTRVPLPPYDDNTYPPREGLTFRHALIAIAVLVVIGLAFVAFALFSAGSDPEDTTGDQITSTGRDARMITGTIAPFVPAQSIPPAAAAMPSAPANVAKITPPAPATPVVPPVVAPPVAAATVAAPPVVLPPVAAPPVVVTPARPAPQFRDVAQAMQAARLAFRANDLSAAQAALGAALAMQPGNSAAQDLASELRPLTSRRDAALQAAQTCIAQQSWPCARAHANEALTIDTGNETARGILARVIRETGWAPLNPRAATAAPAQGKPLAQPQGAAATPQSQLPTPLPQGVPATGDLSAAAPRTGTAGTTNGVDARERAIKDSGWSRAPSNGGKSSTSTPAGQ
ncbi:hypothetical protein CIC12_18140 [Burkholderia sp. SG-MS1]|uniref:hypothetical protein n=1 Tax=Paraburkholderia sp. SG-MS1 TaxID=2023741 RepID=UPI001445713A|nr:hypothetical protein [Paraburkholderia sp. SG-MS1]NKJ48622.1 hypothetical protein [Paraburkholderia sp. SG-MS1]